MAAVEIVYNGGVIAEMDGAGSKTLRTAGTYCEGDVVVAHTPRIRIYEITLPKSSGWVLLTALDEDVLAHIDDAGFTVLMTRQGEYAYEWYAGNFFFVGNTQTGYSGGYPVYGCANRQASETSVQDGPIFYPANNKSTDGGLGGYGQFRLDGNQYSLKASDGFVTAGTYRLTFAW